MINPIDPGSPDAVHLAYRGDNAGICGRSTGVLDSDPGDADCPECDAAYVGIMHADSEREYLALRDAGRTCHVIVGLGGVEMERCGEVLPCPEHDAAGAEIEAARRRVEQATEPAYVGGWISGGCA